MRRGTTGERRGALFAAALVMALVVGTAGHAHADSVTGPRRGPLDGDAPLPPMPSPPDGAPVDEAQRHFRRGVQLYGDGDSAGALVELRRAYALVPSYRVLFNLGQVAYQCGDHAAAFGYLTRYLREGGNQIPEARRKEVAGALAELRPWIGFLSIEAKEPALRVTIDDADVGVTPLPAPIAANAGRRRIDVIARSGDHQTRTVELAAGEILSVPFGMVTPPPSPAVVRGLRGGTQRALPATGAMPAPAEAQAALPVIEPPRPPPPPRPVPSLPPPPAPSLVASPAPQAPRDRSGRGTPWVTWTLAAVAAGGAAATGALAWSTSRSLHDEAARYPVRASDLQDLHDREHRYALASDGFLAGAVVLSAIALYLTLTRPCSSGAPCLDASTSAAIASPARW